MSVSPPRLNAALPPAAGLAPMQLSAGGQPLRVSTADGVTYDPGRVGQPVVSTVAALGFQQAATLSVDPRTLAPGAVEQRSWGQQGDLRPVEMLSPTLLKVVGPDPRYPVGAVPLRSLIQTGSFRPTSATDVILFVTGQSNARGVNNDSRGVVDPTKLTTIAPMPGRLMMFNGGTGCGIGAGSVNVTTVVNPANIATLVDALVGGSYSEYENMALGFGEVMASVLPSGARVIIFNVGISGRYFGTLYGKESTIHWQNNRTIIQRIVTLSTAAGRTPIIGGVALNHGEADNRLSTQKYLDKLATFRPLVDALKPLTGQTLPIPIVVCQTNATRDIDQASVGGATLAQEKWCADPANLAGLVPTYWGKTNDIGTVHHLPPSHRHFGEYAGEVLLDLHCAGVHRHTRMKSAVRTGRTVAVTMSEPVEQDAYAIATVAASGFTYRDGSGSVAVSDAVVSGDQIKLTLATVPSGVSEFVAIGCTGAKLYTANTRYGLGADFGNRSTIRGLSPFWSHTTGRPLWRFAAQQYLAATVAA